MNWPALLVWMDGSTLGVLLAAGVAVLVALVAHAVSARVVLRLTRSLPVADKTAQHCKAPARLLLPLVALQAVWQVAPDTFPLIGAVRHGNSLLLLTALTWLGLRAARGVAQGVISLHPVDIEDNLNARRIHTQTRMLARTAMFIIVLTGLALMLMTFPGARQFGASLLASAGVVGLVAGIAARPIFSNLIAGLQIALAQPFRIDDVLIIQGEWGRVEEITGTYVVHKLWDERRLIVPLQWFIENPFQNWTRTNAQITGTVFLWVDYRMPLAPLREAAQHACEQAPEWDGRTCVLQLMDAGERSLQLRVLVSSSNSGLNGDLRCKVREALVEVMQRDYPQHLPLMRAELAEPRSAQRPTAQPQPGVSPPPVPGGE
jgi:small-conductance mechanosensitive channel